MNVGVIGAGHVGPDLAYGLVTALAKQKEAKLFLVDQQQAALDKAMAHLGQQMEQAEAKGKLSAKAAQSIRAALTPTTQLSDLASCALVLEATEGDLSGKQALLQQVEQAVDPSCFITSVSVGFTRAQLAEGLARPAHFFVVRPTHPLARSKPVEVTPSEDPTATAHLLGQLKGLGKVPLVTQDRPCSLVMELWSALCVQATQAMETHGLSAAQVEAVIQKRVTPKGLFSLLDQWQMTPLVVPCLHALQKSAAENSWAELNPRLKQQGTAPWLEQSPSEAEPLQEALEKALAESLEKELVARARTMVEQEVCHPTELDWLTRMVLGFKPGLLEQAAKKGQLAPSLYTVKVQKEQELAIIAVFRPEAMNALSNQVLAELRQAFEAAAADPQVKGVVLTSFDGALAGADIKELATLSSPQDAEAQCLKGQQVVDLIAGMKKPVVAALNGPVMGGGAELSMGCHARVVGPGLLLAQPEVNLGIIPGYGGTQRLPRLIGFDHAWDLLRTGRPVKAAEACQWGWATGEPTAHFLGAAKALVRDHLAGKVTLAPVNPEPLSVPEQPLAVDLGHHSRAVDALLVDVICNGLKQPLDQGLKMEAAGFGKCTTTEDFAIGMKNFIEKGPRRPAEFIHR